MALFKFRRKNGDKYGEEKPEAVPFPEHADALTVEEYYAQHTNPDELHEYLKPGGVRVRENGADVFYQHSKSGHHWWGWRLAQQVKAGQHGDKVQVVYQDVGLVAREAAADTAHLPNYPGAR